MAAAKPSLGGLPRRLLSLRLHLAPRHVHPPRNPRYRHQSSQERFFCPSHIHEHRPVLVPSLPLITLTISPLLTEDAPETIDESSTALLLPATSKETLREVNLIDASPAAVVKVLGSSPSGYNLTSLRLHYHMISAPSLLEKATAFLPSILTSRASPSSRAGCPRSTRCRGPSSTRCRGGSRR